MDNRGIIAGPDWINHQLQDMRRDIEALRSERRAAATTITDGSLVVSGGGGVEIHDGGDLVILDASENVVFSAADGPVRTAFKQVDLNSVDLAVGFTTYCATTVPVPDGYTRAIVQMATSAGTSLSGVGAGNIGVQPVVAGNAGPGLSQGKTGGGAVSISSSMAIQVPVTGGGTLALHALAYSNGDPKIAGSGNVHLSATVIFTRS
ncbi:hypothetical protein [Nocardioides sp. LHG3406-4]|uniref:hypothetical protein n=1 Tax=Nocardioides sp. LHG3406-4 TaxID=2804575 RepID=UPI003CFBC01D